MEALFIRSGMSPHVSSAAEQIGSILLIPVISAVPTGAVCPPGLAVRPDRGGLATMPFS